MQEASSSDGRELGMEGADSASLWRGITAVSTVMFVRSVFIMKFAWGDTHTQMHYKVNLRRCRPEIDESANYMSSWKHIFIQKYK